MHLAGCDKQTMFIVPAIGTDQGTDCSCGQGPKRSREKNVQTVHMYGPLRCPPYVSIQKSQTCSILHH